MATRRRPRSLPHKLTPDQRALVAKYHYIAVRLTDYYWRKNPRGLIDTDLFSEAQEALTGAVSAADASNEGLESYLWECVRGALKDLIRKTGKEADRSSDQPIDGPTECLVTSASAAFKEFVRGLRDPGDVWRDSRADSLVQLEHVVQEGAAALAVGGAGGVWHMRGDDGFVLRAELVRAIRELRTLVSELPPVLSAIMELRFFQELELKEVAERIGLSVPTITRRIEDAFKLLRARLMAKEIDGLPDDG